MATQFTPGLSFGPAAVSYDAFRPTYPTDALIWALGTRPLSVLDLGAGTGILGRVLLALGHRVVAVEPDLEMLRVLAERSPGAMAVAGAAEAVPVADASVDAVVAGQSYHWFDPSRAHSEIARVLRPGGWFVPIWNVRDPSVGWVARLTEIIEPDRGQDHAAEHLDDDAFAPHLTGLTRYITRHEVPMTADDLVRLVASRSYYLTATPERRAELDAQVTALAGELPEHFAMPYRTIAYRVEKPSRHGRKPS